GLRPRDLRRRGRGVPGRMRQISPGSPDHALRRARRSGTCVAGMGGGCLGVRGRFSRAERARVDDAQEEARLRLLEKTGEPVRAELSKLLGIPGRAASARLLAGLQTLWS